MAAPSAPWMLYDRQLRPLLPGWSRSTNRWIGPRLRVALDGGPCACSRAPASPIAPDRPRSYSGPRGILDAGSWSERFPLAAVSARTLPERPGIYMIFDAISGVPIYVGETSLFARILSRHQPRAWGVGDPWLAIWPPAPRHAEVLPPGTRDRPARVAFEREGNHPRGSTARRTDAGAVHGAFICASPWHLGISAGGARPGGGSSNSRTASGARLARGASPVRQGYSGCRGSAREAGQGWGFVLRRTVRARPKSSA